MAESFCETNNQTTRDQNKFWARWFQVLQRGLEALAVDDSRAGLIVLLLRDPPGLDNKTVICTPERLINIAKPKNLNVGKIN